MYEYKAVIKRVIDGDTVVADIDLGFNLWLHDIRLRFLGIDTPEKRGDKEKDLGMICTKYAESLLQDQKVVIYTNKDKQTDSFGRWLADIYLDDGRSVFKLYNKLGINKYYDTYSEENVRKLEKLC